jgi:hypothetical protein
VGNTNPVTKSSRTRPVRAKDVQLRGKAAQEAKALAAEMERHRGAYDAYVKARVAGQNREPHRAGYTAYKRAYSALLKLRRAAHERQQAKGGAA